MRPGIKLAHARSLLPADRLVIAPLKPERDRAALDALAQWAIRFTPAVAPDPPDGLWLDVTGCERLYRSERALAKRVLSALTRLRLHARVAIAATPGCAWALARCGRLDCSVVPKGREVEALAPLPVAALRIDQATDAALDMMNIRTIGDLLHLPREDIAARLGPALVHRLDQARGRQPESINPIRPTLPLTEEFFFAGATTQPYAIELACRELVKRVAACLRQRESGARELLLAFSRIDAPPQRLTLSLACPSRDECHLWRLLRPRTERINLGYGVESITLTATRAARLAHEQTESPSLGGGNPQRDHTRAQGELIDTLINRLGPDAVLEFDARESLLPERVFELRSALADRPTSTATITPSDRPTILFPTPEPAQVMCLTPDGPVVHLTWRGASATVLTSLGPERIAPHWWESPAASPPRDYFRIQDDLGRWLWLLRTGSTWHVHGEWL